MSSRSALAKQLLPDWSSLHGEKNLLGHDSILLITVLERERNGPSLGYIVSSGTTRATKEKKQNNFSLLYMRGFPSYVCVYMHVCIHIYVHTHTYYVCIWYTWRPEDGF